MTKMMTLVLAAGALVAGCTINGKTYGLGGGSSPIPQVATSDRAVAGPGKAPVDTERTNDDDGDPENEPAPASGTGELAQLKVPPEAGVATAKPQAPPWCATATKVSGHWTPGGVRRTLEAVSSDGYPNLVKGAALLCQWPKDPAVAHATAQVLQVWMNYTGMSQAHAAEALTARLAVDRFTADQEKLCGALAPSQSSTREKALADARQKLFGCAGNPLWMGGGGYDATSRSLVEIFDAGEPDTVARLAHLVSRHQYILGAADDKALLQYVTDHLDFAALTAAALDKAFDAAPYKGNSYARTLVLESRSVYGQIAAKVKAAVDAKAKDSAWRELLVAGPQRGIAEWNKLAAQHKDLLARTQFVEQKLLGGGGRSAAAGCWPALRRELGAMLRGLPHASDEQLEMALHEPIAQLVVDRAAACAAVDLDPAYAQVLLAFATGTRIRGPRVAAFYGARIALEAVQRDHPRFAIADDDMRLSLSNPLVELARDYADLKRSKIDIMGFIAGADYEVTVKTVTRASDHIVVTFPKETLTVKNCEWVDSNRIKWIDSSGHVYYDKDCIQHGFRKVDVTPKPVRIALDYADNIRPGSMMEYASARGDNAWAIPTAVYADKSKKVLVNWNGFGL
ncbi:MAG: hypothetical protein KF773_26570 [Deltaproteobacteria bacterium]|nr:hypothetical protein [Deltaproteobacteria bacterium]